MGSEKCAMARRDWHWSAAYISMRDLAAHKPEALAKGGAVLRWRFRLVCRRITQGRLVKKRTLTMNGSASPDPEQLVCLARAGNGRALGQLLEQYRNYLA